VYQELSQDHTCPKALWISMENETFKANGLSDFSIYLRERAIKKHEKLQIYIIDKKI
jgi:hypothetical protein